METSLSMAQGASEDQNVAHEKVLCKLPEIANYSVTNGAVHIAHHPALFFHSTEHSVGAGSICAQ